MPGLPKRSRLGLYFLSPVNENIYQLAMLRQIVNELARHIPFTASGAATGIIIMVIIIFGNVPPQISQISFYSLHPLHVVLSALVTTAMFRRYSNGKIWVAVVIGYFGSIGIATISDAVIPYLGGALLKINMEFHIPFIETGKMPFIGIEKWQLVNSAALAGIAIGLLRPSTKFPHYGHVLLSTWASLFCFTAFGTASWMPLLPFVFIFLFLAVWLPCCVSDIVFPLLFVRKRLPPPNI
jgi:hypothetical protein